MSIVAALELPFHLWQWQAPLAELGLQEPREEGLLGRSDGSGGGRAEGSEKAG